MLQHNAWQRRIEEMKKERQKEEEVHSGHIKEYYPPPFNPMSVVIPLAIILGLLWGWYEQAKKSKIT